MNRRALVTGAAALAASSVVPASLGAVKADAFSPEALEFVGRVRALDPEAKILLAALFRASRAGQDHRGQRLADLVEELGREEIERGPL